MLKSLLFRVGLAAVTTTAYGGSGNPVSVFDHPKAHGCIIIRSPRLPGTPVDQDLTVFKRTDDKGNYQHVSYHRPKPNRTHQKLDRT